LPMGLDTRIGERGGRLSGGERQHDRGSHDELLRRGGVYARMWLRQTGAAAPGAIASVDYTFVPPWRAAGGRRGARRCPGSGRQPHPSA
jgi:general stress protein YciG